MLIDKRGVIMQSAKYFSRKRVKGDSREWMLASASSGSGSGGSSGSAPFQSLPGC